MQKHVAERATELWRVCSLPIVTRSLQNSSETQPTCVHQISFSHLRSVRATYEKTPPRKISLVKTQWHMEQAAIKSGAMGPNRRSPAAGGSSNHPATDASQRNAADNNPGTTAIHRIGGGNNVNDDALSGVGGVPGGGILRPVVVTILSRFTNRLGRGVARSGDPPTRWRC